MTPGSEVDRSRSDWKAICALAVILALVSAATAGLNRGQVGQMMDDGLYFTAARALAEGRGYVLPSQVGPPIRARYSIGFPALVALALKIAPGKPSLSHDFAVGRGVVVAACWVFVFGSYGWLRRLGVRPWPAMLIGSATLANLTTISLLTAVMSDIPFAALSAVLLYRWADRRRNGNEPRGNFVNGLLTGAAVAVRGNGITLLAGSLMAACRGFPRASRLMNAGVCLAGALLVLVPAAQFTRFATGSRVAGSYTAELAAGWGSIGSGLRVVGANLKAAGVELPAIVFPVLLTRTCAARPAVQALGSAVVLLGLLVGAVRMVRLSRARDIPAWVHVVGLSAIFLVWPWELNTRFILCLVPAVLLTFGRGVESIASGLGAGPQLRSRLATTALVLAASSACAVTARTLDDARRKNGLWGNPAAIASVDRMLDEIRTRLKPEAVVVSMTPELVYLYTGRQGMLLLLEEDKIRHDLGRADRILERMAEAPGRPFYLMGPAPGSTDDPLTAEHSAALARHPSLDVHELFRTNDGRLWLARVRPRSPGT